MENLVRILLFLFIGIVVMVFVVNRFAKPVDDAQVAKLSKWILPLVALLLIVQLVGHYIL